MIDYKHYDAEGNPKACPYCEKKLFKHEVKSIAGGQISEYEIRCGGCSAVIAYWAYGSFDPAYYTIEEKCPAINGPCEHYTCRRDNNGQIAIMHCSHPDNDDGHEGNTTTALCPRMAIHSSVFWPLPPDQFKMPDTICGHSVAVDMGSNEISLVVTSQNGTVVDTFEVTKRYVRLGFPAPEQSDEGELWQPCTQKGM